MIRIVLTGAECTGKTSLASALSGYYGEPWTMEYVRQYVDEVGRGLMPEDVEPIARGQLALEDSALGRAERFILHDTNLLSTILYSNHYFGIQMNWLNDEFLRRDYALYLLCSPEGIEWTPEPGQRDSPEARTVLYKKFKESLQRLQLPYVSLRGTRDARFGQAVYEIDRLLDAAAGDSKI